MPGTRLACRDFVPIRPDEIEDSLTARFARQVRARGKNIAVKYGDEAITYEELDRQSNRIANTLLARCGDRAQPIVLLIEQGITLVACILGILKAGKFYVPLDPTHPPARLRHILTNSSTQVLLCDAPNMKLANELSSGSVRAIETSELAVVETLPTRPVSRDAIAYILYTSGSTGLPKAVQITHRNFYVNAYAMIDRIKFQTDHDVMISWLPMFHDMGMVGFLSVPMQYGAEVVSITPLDFLRRPLLWAELIGKYRGTVTAAPNSPDPRLESHIALIGRSPRSMKPSCQHTRER